MKSFPLMLSLFCFALAPHVSVAQESVAKQPRTHDHAEHLAEIDEYIQLVMGHWDVPGLAIAIVKDGEVVLSRGYGTRELGEDQPVDGDTLFAVASNSKAFTTAGLAVLVDQRKLKWDDPVTKHLPEFKMPDEFVTREMTLRDLVCHRSGMDTFSGDLLWYDTTYRADEVIAKIQLLKPVSSFRSRYGYQNLMYITAGKVIEKASGKSWAEFMHATFLKPVGMNRSTTSVKDIQSNFARPHNESGGNGLRVLPLGDVDNCWGACGINSSANDMAKWMNVWLSRGKVGDKHIISRGQVWQMWQPYTVRQISENAFRNNPATHFSGYGLGFSIYDFHGRKVVSHGGGLDGMISQLAMIPELNLGVMVMTNSESSASRYVRDRVLECFIGVEERINKSGNAFGNKARNQIAAEARRKAKRDSRKSDTKPSKELAEYCGTYRCELYGDVHVRLENERLVVSLVPAPNFVCDLEHWQDDEFLLKWRDTVKYNFPMGFIKFTLDDDGQLDRLIIDQPNNDFWFYEFDLKRVNE